jgi:phosphoserine phosphatase RsbU/P
LSGIAWNIPISAGGAMPGKNSIVVKLVLVITLCSALIFAATLGYNYCRSRRILEQELEKRAQNLVASLVHSIETELVSVAETVKGMALAVETGRYDEKALHELIRTAVKNNPRIYGSTVAFEPYAFSAEKRLYAPYFYRSEGTILHSRLEDAYRNLPYLYWDWYQISRELETLEWSEPYFDEGAGKIAMTTCSVPFYRETDGERHIRGIVTADISLEWLTRLVSSVRVLKTGYASILSRNGVVLAHPLKDAVMNETFFSIAEARNDAYLRNLGKKMVRGGSGFMRYKSLTGVDGWMYYAPIRPTHWTLAVVFPESEYVEDINHLTMLMAIMGFIGILLLTAAVIIIAGGMTKPLRSLAAATHPLAEGNFDAEIPVVRSKDEIGLLAHDFQAMKESLKEYIKNLTETTAAKERIQGELNVAREIQASLLPRLYPPFPDRSEFDIYASMTPAKEVGGDFYDFFFIDDDHLCFLIADVSGKGVPAALYMMVAKTLLKTEGQRLGEPEKMLSFVNAILAEENDSCMFATVFCAILDTRNGMVRFANAGHNPPIFIKDEEIKYLAIESGFVLGPMPDTVYKAETLQMAPGDTLFLYTDGVTEAQNLAEELYGERRLLDALEFVPRNDPAKMAHGIMESVALFAQGAPQSDDITIMAITYRGKTGQTV